MMEYHSTISGNEVRKHAATGMKLENMLSKRSQTQKTTNDDSICMKQANLLRE